MKEPKSRVRYTPAPGFPCPKCSSKIHVSVDMLLSGRSAVCNNCGLQLSLANDESVNTLKKYTHLRDKIEDAGKEI